MTAFCSSDDQLSRCKDEGRRTRFTEAHNHCSEASGVEFGIATTEGNLFQIEAYTNIGFFATICILLQIRWILEEGGANNMR